MKRSQLKRKTPLRAKTPLKRSKIKSKASKPKKRTKTREKLPSVKTVRNKCDKLLTPIIKLLHPKCVLTGQPTQVAHHHIKKSKSTALRYYLPNLVPLTHQAHLRLHCDETFWSSKLVEIYGIEWFQDLEKKKNTIVKADVHFYIKNYERLRNILERLEAGETIPIAELTCG